MRIRLHTIIVLTFIALCIGCSGESDPLSPEFRAGALFESPWAIWESGVASIQCKNVDLSSLVYAGPDADGTVDYPALIDSLHWTIAVTIETDYGEPGYTQIEYAWLDDENYSSSSLSGIAYPGGRYEELASAKVAAMHYSYIDGMNEVDQIEVAIAFMTRQTEGMDTDWEIAVRKLEWSITDFCNHSSPTNTSTTILTSNSADDYHPDLAWDPENGFLHVVWTGDTGETYHPYRVIYECWPRTSWGSTYEVYESGKDYAEWAPRIAIGNSGFAGYDDIVGVVYSAFSNQAAHYHQGKWHVGGACWDVDTEDPGDAVFFNTAYMSSNAGFPRIDLAPRSSVGAGYGSIVFMQHYGNSDYHVIERNNLRGDWWPICRADEDTEGIFGSVSIHPGSSPAKASLSFFEWDDGNEDWDVTVGRFELSTQYPTPNWRNVDTGIADDDLAMDDFINYLLIDTIEPGDITTITSDDYDNAYWLGYCDWIGTHAYCVSVAYGDTT
jgi:hypothetical protein